jgi:hypothetical protein
VTALVFGGGALHFAVPTELIVLPRRRSILYLQRREALDLVIDLLGVLNRYGFYFCKNELVVPTDGVKLLMQLPVQWTPRTKRCRLVQQFHVSCKIRARVKRTSRVMDCRTSSNA